MFEAAVQREAGSEMSGLSKFLTRGGSLSWLGARGVGLAQDNRADRRGPRARAVALLVTAAAMAVVGAVQVRSEDTAASEPTISFQRQVLPIFEQHCVSCHSLGALGAISSHLDLTSYRGLRAGSIAGTIVIPYHAEFSPLMRYIKYNWQSSDKKTQSNDKSSLKMPPFGPQLSLQEIDTISEYINQGAKNN